MSKKLIVVTGATGKQGGSLVKTLLEQGGYEIRALSRKVDSPAAQALSSKGVAVVAGHLGDKESLIEAFKGAYAVFGVSIPAMTGAENEFVQGRNLVDACKANSVPLLVWSSLPSVKESSNGKYTRAAHFDDKAEVDKYIKTVGQPAIIFQTGGFTSNLVNFGLLQRDQQDPSKWHIVYPIRPKVEGPWTYVERDFGPAVAAAIGKWEDPSWRAELSKQPIPLISYLASGEELAATTSRVTGKDVDYVVGSPDVGIVEVKEVYAWADEGFLTYPGNTPPDILVKLGVKFHTLEDYVRDVVVPFINSQK